MNIHCKNPPSAPRSPFSPGSPLWPRSPWSPLTPRGPGNPTGPCKNEIECEQMNIFNYPISFLWHDISRNSFFSTLACNAYTKKANLQVERLSLFPSHEMGPNMKLLSSGGWSCNFPLATKYKPTYTRRKVLTSRLASFHIRTKSVSLAIKVRPKPVFVVIHIWYVVRRIDEVCKQKKVLVCRFTLVHTHLWTDQNWKRSEMCCCACSKCINTESYVPFCCLCFPIRLALLIFALIDILLQVGFGAFLAFNSIHHAALSFPGFMIVIDLILGKINWFACLKVLLKWI